MIDFPALYELAQPELQPWLAQLRVQLPQRFNAQQFGDLPRWLDALSGLPDIKPSRILLDSDAVTIGQASDMDAATHKLLEQQLRQLHPWRKGPFDLFGVYIDTEWRSDWKWDRIKDHLAPLAGRTVLDVGCGSGYHCWRMRGAGAATVIGIEPTALFIVQFHALQRYVQDRYVHVVPQRIEEMPPALHAFDTVFSMGILYHRRSPLDHLLELKAALKPGGQLVLETLVIDGECGKVLVPEGRYGKMGNTWFIPSPLTMESWLKKTGFVHVRCVNVCRTTTDEQRRTDWMTFQSLADFLDPQDHTRTVEGYPAPQRAVFIADSPA